MQLTLEGDEQGSDDEAEGKEDGSHDAESLAKASRSLEDDGMGELLRQTHERHFMWSVRRAPLYAEMPPLLAPDESESEELKK